MTGSRGLDIWRDRLPVASPLVSLGEGETPLIALERLGARIGLPRLKAKMESMNPTGSYKDRIAAVSITLACERGMKGWIATSSGNAGMALAAYGARAGLSGILCCVPDMPREKMLPLLAMGITVLPVDGVGTGGTPEASAASFAAVTACAQAHNLYLGVTAHAFNDAGMRGADTIGYEIARDAPDARAVYVPTGGGGLAAATARGLADAGAATATVICQPSGCSPISDHMNGMLDEPRIARCDTGISGLQLPAPPDGRLAADLARAAGGWGASAPDAAIHDARDLLARTEGVFVEPASATALATAINDRETGRLGPDDEVILLLTGAGLKELGSIEARCPRPARIPPADIPGRVRQALGE